MPGPEQGLVHEVADWTRGRQELPESLWGPRLLWSLWGLLLSQLDHRARGSTGKKLESPWVNQRGGEVADFFYHLENIIRGCRFQARRWVTMVRSLEILLHPKCPPAEMQECWEVLWPHLQSRAGRNCKERFPGQTGGQASHARRALLQVGPALPSDEAGAFTSPQFQFWVHTDLLSSWPCFPPRHWGKFAALFYVSLHGKDQIWRTRILCEAFPEQHCSQLSPLFSFSRSCPPSFHNILHFPSLTSFL